MREQNLPKVTTLPLVQDVTQPLPEAATTDMPKPGATVGASGNPGNMQSPVYIESLGHCVWLTVTVVEEFIEEDGDIVIEDGIPLTE